MMGKCLGVGGQSGMGSSGGGKVEMGACGI